MNVRFPYDYVQVIPLLKHLFKLVGKFERDDSRLGSVFPRIQKFLKFLETQAGKRPLFAEVYNDFAEIVSKATIGSENGLFQLAYVLTPQGRAELRKTFFGRETGEVHDEAAEKTTEETAEKTAEETAGEEEEDDDPVIRPALHVSSGSDDMDEADDVLADPQNDENDSDEAGALQRDPNTEPEDWGDFGEVLSECGSSCDLWEQAKVGLTEFMTQFDVAKSEAQLSHVHAMLQHYVNTADNELELKADPIVKNVYCWLAFADDREWATLADLALRFEALVCSEAISERTNGEIRRILGTRRLRMGKDVLMSRMTVAKHGTGGKI
jgi:hypothetical protein